MRIGRVPLAYLMLVLTSLVLQVSCNNDLYREGEKLASNEFLEVKQEESTVLDSLKRLKRQWDSFFGPTTEEANDNEYHSKGNDDADSVVVSGVPNTTESEPGQNNLRVTFLILEPYFTAYSNRDSHEFQYLSHSLTTGIDELFESLPDTQRSSSKIVRIQPLVNDDFLCNVTCDIVTTNNADTDTIKDILRNHIKNNGRLGNTSVLDRDFTAHLIKPGTPLECDFTEFSCDGAAVCLPMSVKCNGRNDCRDGADEIDCPLTEKNFRFTFQIMEPYITAYSNRDSPEFKNLSRLLFTAVSSVFENLPGRPRSRLEIVRIEPLANDDFVCNVTCEIWTTFNKYTNRIKGNLRRRELLWIYIKNNGRLGDFSVRNSDDSEKFIEPVTAPDDAETTDTGATTIRSNTDVYPPNNNRCDETRCVEQIHRCDGIAHCIDEIDTAGCCPHIAAALAARRRAIQSRRRTRTRLPAWHRSPAPYRITQQELRPSENDLQEEIRQMHQEIQQLHTELAQLKDSLQTNKCTSSKSERPSVDDTIASVQWQLNEHDQGLRPKDVEVTGIPEGKVITIKLSVSVADAERARPIRYKPVEKSGRSISISVAADPVAHQSRSISASLNRR